MEKTIIKLGGYYKGKLKSESSSSKIKNLSHARGDATIDLIASKIDSFGYFVFDSPIEARAVFIEISERDVYDLEPGCYCDVVDASGARPDVCDTEDGEVCHSADCVRKDAAITKLAQPVYVRNGGEKWYLYNADPFNFDISLYKELENYMETKYALKQPITSFTFSFDKGEEKTMAEWYEIVNRSVLGDDETGLKFIREYEAFFEKVQGESQSFECEKCGCSRFHKTPFGGMEDVNYFTCIGCGQDYNPLLSSVRYIIKLDTPPILAQPKPKKNGKKH